MSELGPICRNDAIIGVHLKYLAVKSTCTLKVCLLHSLWTRNKLNRGDASEKETIFFYLLVGRINGSLCSDRPTCK